MEENPSDGGNEILGSYYKVPVSELKEGKVYRQPTVTTSTTDSNLDDVISDGDSFLKSGADNKINKEKLSSLSGNLYNILLTIGVAVAVIVGAVLGIKFIIASVEEKAVVKEGLIAYAAGCVIVFGAFAIWKIAVTLLQSV